MLRKIAKTITLTVTTLLTVGLLVIIKNGFDFRKTFQKIPRYPNAKYFDVRTTSYPDDAPGIFQTFESEAGKEEIAAFYLEKMVSGGWKVTNKTNPRDELVPILIKFEKEKYTVSFLVGGKETEKLTRIHLTKK